jgi:hypothetical protein
MTRATPAPANRINHVVIVGDESSSMTHHARAFVQVFDGLVADLVATSTDMDQETRISFYAFANHTDIRCLIWDKDVLRVPTIGGLYRPHGVTALIDASCLAIDELSQTPVMHGDHSFLFLGLTDGQENDSRGGPHDLAARIAARGDNWTFGIFVPDKQSLLFARRCGFPEDNVSVWDTASAAGFASAGQMIRDSAQVFMQARARGERRVSSLFRVNAVSTEQARASLIPLANGAYDLYPVTQEADIADFAQVATGAPYRKGSCYYQLERAVTIQDYKGVVVEGSDGRLYTGGGNVRQLLGLPEHGSARVRPAGHGCTVFVQSTSYNRKLRPGTRLLVMR